jgi:hypothetical protein
MNGTIDPPPEHEPAEKLPSSVLAGRLIGATVSGRDETNGYVFWGLVALFIGIPELLAAFSKTLKADIPWPTISNLVGRDLESHHHWVALIVVGVIVVVTLHTLESTDGRKKAGRTLRAPAEQASDLAWGRWYIAVVAGAGAVAGLVASAADADKNQLGYAIYVTLTVTGVVVPSALAYWANRVLDIPTLFAALAFLRHRAAWVAALVVALLVVLMFHLALYPWPNYHFGAP